MEKGFKSNMTNKFFNILLTGNRELVKFLDIGTKFKPLQRTDFSASESGRLQDMSFHLQCGEIVGAQVIDQNR